MKKRPPDPQISIGSRLRKILSCHLGTLIFFYEKRRMSQREGPNAERAELRIVEKKLLIT